MCRGGCRGGRCRGGAEAVQKSGSGELHDSWRVGVVVVGGGALLERPDKGSESTLDIARRVRVQDLRHGPRGAQHGVRGKGCVARLLGVRV